MSEIRSVYTLPILFCLQTSNEFLWKYLYIIINMRIWHGYTVGINEIMGLKYFVRNNLEN